MSTSFGRAVLVGSHIPNTDLLNTDAAGHDKGARHRKKTQWVGCIVFNRVVGHVRVH